MSATILDILQSLRSASYLEIIKFYYMLQHQVIFAGAIAITYVGKSQRSGAHVNCNMHL
jgi:hypothetical protein